MDATFIRTALTWGLISLVVLLAGCSVDPLNSQREEIEVEQFRSEGSSTADSFTFNPNDCSGSLFGSSNANPANSIDFCKELMIIDPEITRGMPDLSFTNVMNLMLDTNTQATYDIMKSWADTWKDVKDKWDRSDISKTILEAWQDDRIKLIAVVNRLDLARAPGDGLGEGRLVYQMLSSDANTKYLPMTFILEFEYPKLDSSGTKQENLTLWAEKWHALSRLPISATEFRFRLRSIIGEFALSRHLRKLRTNEALSKSSAWAFREHKFSSCEGSQTPDQCHPALSWSSLPDTPLDALRDDNRPILHYLENDHVKAALEKGEHDFGVDYDHNPNTNIELAWLAETGDGPTWVSPTREGNESMLLMAFNTCNGCHADFKTSHDILPHIGIQPEYQKPSLSSFLTGEIFMYYRLAGCRGTTSLWLACGENGPIDAKYTWNEQKHRAYHLFLNLRANQKRTPPPEPLFQYRYH